MPARCAVLSIGTAVPPHRVTQDAAAEIVGRAVGPRGGSPDLVRRLFRSTGVEARHTVLAQVARGEIPFTGPLRGTGARMAAFREHAPPLAAAACRIALERARVAPSRVTHLVVVTCTGFYAPGPDADLVALLGLAPDVDRTLVGFMGCHGAFAGLRTARRAVEADPRAVALVVCVELCSLHLRDAPARGSVVAHALFGDGAAAAVLAAPPEDGGVLTLGPAASFLAEDTGPMMGWEIGDDGFAMTLSRDVPALLGEQLSGFATRLLAGTDRDDVAAWCVHPGGPSILDAAREALGLSDEDLAASRDVLRDPGNVSSATILFVLERAAAALGSGDRGVALGFGPGLTIEGFTFLRGARVVPVVPTISDERAVAAVLP